MLRRYDKILVPEMNLGQLLKLVRAEFLVDAVGYNRVRGLPFKAAELEDAITAMVSRDGEGEPAPYRSRKDGSVAIFWRNRPATVLTGMLATRFEAAPEASEEERSS